VPEWEQEVRDASVALRGARRTQRWWRSRGTWLRVDVDRQHLRYLRYTASSVLVTIVSAGQPVLGAKRYLNSDGDAWCCFELRNTLSTAEIASGLARDRGVWFV
jgi:hypothetical protein